MYKGVSGESMRKFGLIVMVSLLAAGVLAQRESQNRKTLGSQASSPVRVSEVNTTLLKYERVIRKVLGLPGASAPAPSNDQKAATRGQILNGLNRLFEMSKPEFKITPRDTKYDGNLISLPRGSSSRAIAEKLIKWGFVGKVSPLATSKSDTLSLAEFGDTMGLFLSRVADLTHTPNTKFSPYLQGG